MPKIFLLIILSMALVGLIGCQEKESRNEKVQVPLQLQEFPNSQSLEGRKKSNAEILRGSTAKKFKEEVKGSRIDRFWEGL